MIKMISLSLLLATAAPANLQDVMASYGLKVKGEPMKVIKDQKVAGKTKSQHVIEAESPKGERLEIKIISPVDAEPAKALVETEQTAMRKLYAAPQTPYMGDIAQAIGGCPAQMGPVKESVNIGGHQSEALIGAATNDRTFGACGRESGTLRGALVAYYVPETKAVWTWRVFAPWPAKQSSLGSAWLNEILKRFEK